MPQLDTDLPHFIYYFGLILFPIFAFILARRPLSQKRDYKSTIAYMIWLMGGFMGLHRFYLKKVSGLVYLPIFLLILFANTQSNDARSIFSNAANEVKTAQERIARDRPKIEETPAVIADLQRQLDEAEEGSFSKKSTERKLKRTVKSFEQSKLKLAEAEQVLAKQEPIMQAAADKRETWSQTAAYLFYLILALMAVDAFLMPRLVRAANQTLADEPEEKPQDQPASSAPEDEIKQDWQYVSKGWTGWLDRLSLYSGEFVAYWSVIAVIVYYFEVISRYVFNSPTNWAHESMYLMFGMQYLIAGSYAMLCEAHVRVDIFYAAMGRRYKAMLNILTSCFFFIFAFTLLITSWIFAVDAIAVPAGNSIISDFARGDIDFMTMLGGITLSLWTDPNIRWGEFSFNEWEIPLWPMKWMMVVGGILLILQGVSKLAQDFRILIVGE